MAIELPKEFKNIPLAMLWESVVLADELCGLAEGLEQEAYWQGRHDAIAFLLGQLTGKKTVYLRADLHSQFSEFREEDQLMEMEKRLKDDE